MGLMEKLKVKVDDDSFNELIKHAFECPDDDEIILFLQDNFKGKTKLLIKKHFDDCSLCRDKLQYYKSVLKTTQYKYQFFKQFRYAIAALMIVAAGLTYYLSTLKTPVHKDNNQVFNVQGKVKMVIGNAEIITNGIISPALVNLKLTERDVIKTYDGIVDFELKGIGIFKIKSYSQLELKTLSTQIKFKLNKGKILVALNKLKNQSCSSFEIETITTVIGVRGTSFLVSAEGTITKIGVLTDIVTVRYKEEKKNITELRQVVTRNKIQGITKMDAGTIMDIKDILKIKGIEKMPEFEKIKLNIKKLEVIEGKFKKDKFNINDISGSVKGKNLQDDEKSDPQNLKKKYEGLKTDKTIKAKNKQRVDDKDF